MDTITKEISDVVCTAITLGHIVKYNEKNSNRSTSENSNNNLKIIYEKHLHPTEDELKEEDLHKKLKDKLSEIGCGINLTCLDPDKRDTLLITGDSKYLGGVALEEYNKEISQKLEFINDKINKSLKEENEKNGSHQKLYGAYIGGFYNANEGEIRLLAPSQIIIKQAGYILEGIDKIRLNSKYEQYKKLSKLIMDSLLEATDKATKVLLNVKDVKVKLDHDYINKKTLIPTDTELKLDKNGNQNIFGSVHGLVQAIIYYRLGKASKDTACEFAFSNDTTKVGSCIPCSIFASSNDTPVNSTHFGRGDNWNLPQSCKEYNGLDMKRKAWEAYVQACFKTGIDIVNDNVDKNDKNIENAINTVSVYKTANTDKIPEIFLHSLMYEGSFINKMCRIFNI